MEPERREKLRLELLQLLARSHYGLPVDKVRLTLLSKGEWTKNWPASRLPKEQRRKAKRSERREAVENVLSWGVTKGYVERFNDLILEDVNRRALKAWIEAGKDRVLFVPAFVQAAFSTNRTLDIVAHNAQALKERGMYETALVYGYTARKPDYCTWDIATIESLFQAADREKLRAVGALLPGPGPFAVYRGVGRQGYETMIDGMSWSLSLDVACTFANDGDHDPAVYKAVVQAEEAYCYVTDDDQEELICRPKMRRRLALSLREIRKRAGRWDAVRRCDQELAEEDEILASLCGWNDDW